MGGVEVVDLHRGVQKGAVDGGLVRRGDAGAGLEVRADFRVEEVVQRHSHVAGEVEGLGPGGRARAFLPMRNERRGDAELHGQLGLAELDQGADFSNPCRQIVLFDAHLYANYD